MTRTLIASGLVLALALPALASFTTISPSAPGEFNIEQILEAQYGGNFTASGVDFINGGPGANVNAIRWDDVLTPIGQLTPINPTPGSAADQIWTNADITAEAVARFAGGSQQLGIDRGSGFELLFNVSGTGMSASGNGGANLSGQTWRWIRRNTNGNNPFNSQNSLNSDGLDHMVTYRITGLNTSQTVWLLCFEDVAGALPTSDRDFNDLAVEVRAVPEPATCGLLASGGIAFLPIRRRR